MAKPIDVPWVVAWTSEQTFWVGNLNDGRPAMMQSESPGIGLPLFSFRNIMRLRRCFVEELCSVCGSVLGLDAYLFPTGEVKKDEFVFSDTPVHKHCAEHSQRHCPYLKRNRATVIRIPDRLESRVLRRAFDGAEVIESYAYVMGNRAFREWANG